MSTTERPSPRPWALALLSLILFVGVGICSYLTWHHENELYGDAAVELGNCPQTEEINCEAVNTSEYSEIAGIPVATFGIPTYLLLIFLLATSRRSPRRLAYVVAIGLLTTLFSGYLYYVSVEKIGFLCKWCMRLYAINGSIPILAWIASRRSPGALGQDLVGDLKTWPSDLKLTAGVFGGLLVLSIGGQMGYRASLERIAPPDPEAEVVEAAPEEHKKNQKPAAKANKGKKPPKNTASASSFKLPAPLKLLVPGKNPRTSSFDLESKIGQGKPVALIFWAPGYRHAEAELVRQVKHFRENASEFDVYAVSGRGKRYKNVMIWEAFKMLDLPDDVPLLIDEGYKVSKALKLTDVPNTVLFDRKGTLVYKKVKSLNHTVAYSPKKTSGKEIIAKINAEPSVPAIKRPRPYYPGNEIIGSCAPSFTLNDFTTGKEWTFQGKNPNGRPTLLMFWSSTCKHCQKEIPKLLKHHNANKDKYDVVTVTRIKKDNDKYSHRTVTQKYIERLDIPWRTLEDPGSAASALYNVVSTPTTVLIKPDGTIEDIWYFAHNDMEKTMTKALAKLNTPSKGCKAPEALPAPTLDFTAISPEGAKKSIAAVAKGKPTVVHLWATWCKPCQKELPSLMRFKKELEAMGGQMIVVSVESEEDAQKITDYARKNNLPLNSYYAPEGGLGEDVDLSYSLPRTFILGADGSVLITRYGEQKWDDAHFKARMLSMMRNMGQN